MSGLPSNINDREFSKFAVDANGDVVIRVMDTSANAVKVSSVSETIFRDNTSSLFKAVTVYNDDGTIRSSGFFDLANNPYTPLPPAVMTDIADTEVMRLFDSTGQDFLRAFTYDQTGAIISLTDYQTNGGGYAPVGSESSHYDTLGIVEKVGEVSAFSSPNPSVDASVISLLKGINENLRTLIGGEEIAGGIRLSHQAGDFNGGLGGLGSYTLPSDVKSFSVTILDGSVQVMGGSVGQNISTFKLDPSCPSLNWSARLSKDLSNPLTLLSLETTTLVIINWIK